jgi:hypothetical protein
LANGSQRRWPRRKRNCALAVSVLVLPSNVARVRQCSAECKKPQSALLVRSLSIWKDLQSAGRDSSQRFVQRRIRRAPTSTRQVGGEVVCWSSFRRVMTLALLAAQCSGFLPVPSMREPGPSRCIVERPEDNSHSLRRAEFARREARCGQGGFDQSRQNLCKAYTRLLAARCGWSHSKAGNVPKTFKGERGEQPIRFVDAWLFLRRSP